MAERWRCKECRRECVVRINEPHAGCMICGSPELERVTFQPQFRGGDIERHELPTADPAVLDAQPEVTGPSQVLAAPPPLTLVADAEAFDVVFD